MDRRRRDWLERRCDGFVEFPSYMNVLVLSIQVLEPLNVIILCPSFLQATSIRGVWSKGPCGGVCVRGTTSAHPFVLGLPLPFLLGLPLKPNPPGRLKP